MVTCDMLTNPPSPSGTQRWDIFCAVIDNFGDIGVCWRLAKQLATEYLLAVRLWVDDLDSFSRLCPFVNPSAKIQHYAGVEICHWPQTFPEITESGKSIPIRIADVVIESFGCRLPEAYLHAMVRATKPPYWINLEYLSAEAWVKECHGLPSPHPQWPLVKYFFIPGFDSNSAGLLREKDLLLRSPETAAHRLWSILGNPPKAKKTVISLFAYENPAIGNLIKAWSRNPTPLLCLVPESRILDSLSTALGQKLQAGDQFTLEQLELRITPFLTQENYDDLLLTCDINFVRGEDSLVRAIWAGKPFIWHIYPQDKQHHLTKLTAFLEHYSKNQSPTTRQALQTFWQAWNHGDPCVEKAWGIYHAYQAEIASGTQQWRQQLAEQEDLARALANFCKTPIMAGSNLPYFSQDMQ